MLYDHIPDSPNVLAYDVSSISLEDEHLKPYKIPKLDWHNKDPISQTSFDLNKEEKCRGLLTGQFPTTKYSPLVLKR